MTKLFPEFVLPQAAGGASKVAAFVDTSIAGWQVLVAELPAGVEVVAIDGAGDGLAQMAAWAATHQGYDALHILSHGGAGRLSLGTTALTSAALAQADVAAELAALGAALKPDGDLLLYGCDVAAGEQGQAFLAAVASATGADVAASNDATGAAAMGGNWTLESWHGHVQAPALGTLGYSGLLSTITFQAVDSDLDYSRSSVTRLETVSSRNITFEGGDPLSGNGLALLPEGGSDYLYSYTGVANDYKVTISVADVNYSFDLTSVKFFSGASLSSAVIELTYANGTTYSFNQGINAGTSTTVNIFSTSINDVTKVVISAADYLVFNDFAISDVKAVVPPPTVSAARISYTSTGSGTGGTYKIGDTVTVSWDNSGTGDANAGVTAVTVDFSQFGGGTAEPASEVSGIWTASYTILAGSFDLAGRKASVTASNAGASSAAVATTSGLTLDNVAPTVTDAKLSISGASGTGGAFKIGDTVTASWNNTAGGDNNADTISAATVDFSAFGGGSAVSASNSSGTWTATYTITSGALDGSNRNVSLTATDNAGNARTTADSSNATVDNVAPTVSDAHIALSGASGVGGAYKIGDTVTVTWNNTAAGDNNADTIAAVTVDFSQFGGGAAVSASNSSGTWTATYTIVSGALDGLANRNVSVTATDNAGNSSTTADTSNATVDNVAPGITLGSIMLSADTGSSSNDFITATTAQTVSATLSAALGAGDIVYASLDNGSTWNDVTASVSGTTLTWNTTLSGAGTLKLKVSDAAGNDGVAASQAYVLDTSAPAAPSAPDMTAGSDSGASSSDDITNDATPTFAGTAESGSTVTLYDSDGTTVLGTGIAAGGNWTITASALAAGSHTITAKATDTAGNTSSASSTLTLTLDTSAPTGMALSTASVATGNAGSAAALATLSASDSQAVTYAMAVGDGSNDANNGNFTISGNTLSVGGAALTAGSYKIYLKATDAAGNIAYQAFTITVVDAPSVSSIVRAGAASSTVLANASSIDYTVTFSESVTGVDIADFALSATSTASGNISAISGSGATYTVTVDSLSGDGTLRLDLNGSGTGIANGSSTAIGGGYAAGQLYTLDHTAPTTTFSNVAFSADTGTSASDLLTATTAQTISATLSATLAAGDVVHASLDGGANWTDVTSSVSGTTLAWSTTLAASGTLQLKVTDAAGNEGAASSQAYVLDTSAPTGLGLSTSSAASVATASGATLATLSASDGNTVTYALGVGNGSNDADNGSFVVAGNALKVGGTALAAGTYNIYLTATDAAGNSSGQAVTFTVLDAPTVSSIVRAASAPSSVAGSATSVSYTVTFSESVSGVDASDFVLTATGTASGSVASVSGSGSTYTVTVNSLAGDGTLRLDLKNSGTGIANGGSTALAGGYTAGEAYALDHTAPATTVATAAFSADTGSSATDFITSVASQTISGTLSANLASGESVQVSTDNGSSWSSATASVGANTWSLAATLAGSSTLKVRVLDAAGNAGTAFAQAFSWDNAAPAAPAAPTVAAASDLGTSNSDAITNDLTPTINGTAESGSIVTLYDTDGSTVLGTATASGGSWSITSSALSAGSHTLTAKATDAAGNVSAASAALALTLDSSAPALSIASAAATLNAGSSTTITFTFSEDPGSTFTLADVTVSGGTLSALSGSGTVRTAQFTATTVGNATLSVAGASYIDSAGNFGAAATAPALTITAAPPPPAPPTPVIDGVPVTTSTATDAATGLPVTTVSVGPVTATRQEDSSTPNSGLADIPLGVANGSGQTGLTVSLGIGTGLQAQSPAALLNNGQALLDLIQRIEDRTPSGSSSRVDLTGDAQDFLSSLGSQTPLQTATVTPSGGAGSVVAVNGHAQAGPQGYAVGLVLDARQLGAGSTLQLDNVEYAAVVGSATLRGGAGSNFVVGDSASQNIFLGAEDDILNGGAGDDAVGSRGGNDILDGGADNDLVAGGEGDDQVLGGAGDDVLVGGRSTGGDWDFYIDAQGVLTARHGHAVLAATATEMVQGAELLPHASALGFMAADSAHVVDVALLYSVLGRAPDLDGLAFWAQAPVPLLTVAEHILASDESLAHNGQQDDQAYLDSIYQQVLGRTADAGGKAFWSDALAHGVSRAEVLAHFALSAEHRAQASTVNGVVVAQARDVGETGWLAASGNDRLDGGAGDDRLLGGDGSDVLVGGTGRDTAVYTARLAEHRLLLGSDGQLRVQTRAGSDIDTLSGIEVAAFSDQSLELDFMAAPAAHLKSLGLLYEGVLGRAADVGGLRWWLATGLEGQQLVSAFARTEESKAHLAGLSDAALVQMLYAQAGLAEGAAGGAASWQNYLATHSRDELLTAWIGNEAVQAAHFGGDGLWLI